MSQEAPPVRKNARGSVTSGGTELSVRWREHVTALKKDVKQYMLGALFLSAYADVVLIVCLYCS